MNQILHKRKNNFISSIFDVLLLFLFVFSIELPIIGNTTFLVYLLCFGLFLYKPNKILVNIRVLLHDRFTIRYILLLLLLVLMVFFVVVFHSAYDFTLLPTLINLIINLFAVIFLCGYFGSKEYDFFSFLKIILFVFLLQSIIEIFALLSPSVLNFVQSFHKDEFTLMKFEEYGARKGLALSGSVFFALAVTFGFSILIYFRYLLLKSKLSIYDAFLGLIIVVGAVLSGRTAVIGLIIGLLYFFVVNRSKDTKRDKLGVYLKKTFLIVFVVVFVGGVLFPSKVLNNLIELSHYFFEFLYAYIDSGSFSISSTKTMSTMYFLPEFYTLVFGDGYYSSPDGLGYYMETDIGYMRNILLFGLVGLILLVFIELYLFFGRYLSKEEKYFYIFSFLYFIVIHGKGEVLVYSIMLHKVLFLLIFYSLLQSKVNLK